MDEAGVDVSILSCLLGWSATLEECRFINDDLSRLQKKSTTICRLSSKIISLQFAIYKEWILAGTAAELLSLA
jgi:hypothetical protein